MRRMQCGDDITGGTGARIQRSGQDLYIMRFIHFRIHSADARHDAGIKKYCQWRIADLVG